jgi:hypothetical protein
MNDNDAAELLDRLVATAPVATAPTTALVRAGRARRRRTWAAGLSVAAVVAVVGGVALAGTLGDGSGRGGETGVADDPTPTVTESTGPPVAGLDVPPAPDDPIYVQWTQRVALTSCGVIDPGSMFGDLPPEEKAAWRCLDQARDTSSGGEVAMSFSTIEGDPIRYWYRVTPAGRFEMYADASEDKFGSGKWEFYDCELPRILRRGCGG